MSLFDLFKKKPPADRYAGKPLLKLVDSFVLKTIGHLDPSQEAVLQQMTPKLQETFKRAGTWEEIVMAELRFEPEVRAAIQDLWEKNQVIARQNGVSLTPIAFTEMFVAKNVASDA
jgi:hypothetical protein